MDNLTIPDSSIGIEVPEKKRYQPVIAGIEDWPIVRFFQQKQQIIDAVVADTRLQLIQRSVSQKGGLESLIEKTMYLEQIRMYEEPWKVDPKDEPKFWSRVKRELVSIEQHMNEDSAAGRYEGLLEEIVMRYTKEISSTFKVPVYHFIRRVLPFIFSHLLNASAGKNIRSVIHPDLTLQEKIHLLGDTEAIRNLSTKGTVILVPTHLSNMDSILVGWGIHALGLPAFIYGAGLNLYNNAVLPFFMARLGAYKVDRRKKNPIYLETLKNYVTHATREGNHGIFFPGGTRSRSGAIESKLKLGLMGTAIETQRLNLIDPPKNHPGKIFIVPMVMSYHFVLEAASLINQHLKSTGQEQYYYISDEFSDIRKFSKFVWTSFSKTSEIALAFGKPMDVLGNFVDEEGKSIDERGHVIDIADYFSSKGKISEDRQRDEEYTRMLGERIAERYYIENRVFSSHIVAFVAFELLKKQHPQNDLYGLLRLQEDERMIAKEELDLAVERILNRLYAMAVEGKVHLAAHVIKPVQELVSHGITNLGIYHSKRPLKLMKDGAMATSDSMNLLYYYHNRLTGYGLEKFITGA